MKLIDKDKLKVAILKRIYPITGENGENSVGMSANDIMEIIHAQPDIMQWNKIEIRKLDEDEERCGDPDCTHTMNNLPEFGKKVLVTDGTSIWVDSVDVDDDFCIYLSTTGRYMDNVIAWAELPEPYRKDER